jgi:16S rRNA processing protein RimM
VIERDQAVLLLDGTFYDCDIIGLEVRTESGDHLGPITDVLHLPANDVYVVKTAEKEVLVPATREVVLEIDTASKRMKIRAIDGLLD